MDGFSIKFDWFFFYFRKIQDKNDAFLSLFYLCSPYYLLWSFVKDEIKKWYWIFSSFLLFWSNYRLPNSKAIFLQYFVKLRKKSASFENTNKIKTNRKQFNDFLMTVASSKVLFANNNYQFCVWYNFVNFWTEY